MLISKKMNEAVNGQVGREFGAMLQYVAVASYFARESLPEMAAFFYAQAEDERDHALRFVKYVVDTGGRVQIPAIAAPKNEFKSIADAVQLSLDWERAVTKQINELAELAIKESDHITQNFLQWFMNEQLEEVSTMDTLLKVVERAGPDRLLQVEEYILRRGGPKTGGAPGRGGGHGHRAAHAG
jgi:ferritin